MNTNENISEVRFAKLYRSNLRLVKEVRLLRSALVSTADKLMQLGIFGLFIGIGIFSFNSLGTEAQRRFAEQYLDKVILGSGVAIAAQYYLKGRKENKDLDKDIEDDEENNGV